MDLTKLPEGWPRYVSNKTVAAFKIDTVDSLDGVHYAVRGEGFERTVDQIWINKHAPDDTLHPSSLAGGYFIAYPDGYTSWSPAKSFEEGYTIQNVDAEAADDTEPPADA